MKRILLFIGALGVIGVGIAVFVLLQRGGAPDFEFITVERGDLVQEVSVTGQVKPAERVDLAFERTGKIAHVLVAIGDTVTIGQMLLVLEQNEVQAELTQAQARVNLEYAKLAQLLRGTRQEEIQLQEVKVRNAEASSREAKLAFVDTLKDSYTKADDGIRNKVDQSFLNPRTDPKFNLGSPNDQLKRGVEFQRLVLESSFTSWNSSLAKLNIGSDLDTYNTEAKEQLEQVKTFLDDLAFMINDMKATSSASQTKLDAYRADVSLVRASINTAVANLAAAKGKLQDTDSTLTLEKQELVVKKSGSSAEEIEAQEAAIQEAEASVENYHVELAKTTILSPINGIVTSQDTSVGEIVTANTSIIAVISPLKFQVETNIPEADIAKVHVGDRAKITLDAYGSDVIFNARVVTIDPGETIIEGISTYRTKLQFSEDDDRVRPGMTANIELTTALRENIIAVPQRAILTIGGEKKVRLISGNTFEVVPVKTGIRGSDGRVEITEGLNVGDRIVTFLEI